MNPIFRTSAEADLPQLIELMAQLGYSHTAQSLTHNIQAVRTQQGELFVAELNGKVCGCVSAIIDVRLAEGINGEIVSLVVSAEARGLGIGKGLVKHAEGWLSQRTTMIRVRANSSRQDAHHFYENLGYTQAKTQIVFNKLCRK